MIALIALLFMVPGMGWAQTVVTGLSVEDIALTADFNGSEIFVFGAVRRDAPPDATAKPLEIVITIKGPPEPVTVRRKERRFGIWVNTEAVIVRRAPSFYAIATTGPLGDLLTETEQLRHGIGMDQAVRRVGSHPTIRDTRPFGEAVVRLRAADGLYTGLDGAVEFAEETLFSTRIALPNNITEGDYTAEFFLIRDRAVISSGETRISVRRAGLERLVYNMSQQEPLLYGILSVLIALVAGWLAAAIFRLAKR